MDPRPLNESLQEMLCRSGNGTGNGPGTGNGTNGSVCDLLRRGLRGPPAPRGESRERGKERDEPGKGLPLPPGPALPGTPAPRSSRRDTPVPAALRSGSPGPCRCRPRLPPCLSSHPSPSIPAPRARWPRLCPALPARISALPGGNAPGCAGGSRRVEETPADTDTARPAPLPHCRGRDLQVDPRLGCPHPTSPPEPRPLTPSYPLAGAPTLACHSALWAGCPRSPRHQGGRGSPGWAAWGHPPG